MSTWATFGAAVTILFAALPMANAQTASNELTQPLEEITVVGHRRQARESIAAKLDEDLIADFLTADELGRQPDLNVADSLRRLPGVVTIFDEDEGRYVGLRGLDQRYTFISIDGGLIASTDRSDRDINIESIPPTAVKRLEVYKSITPDLDGQSVGGVINLVTRSAFDADGMYVVANAQAGYHNSIGDLPQSFDNPSPRVDFAWSNTFANDTIGLLVSGTWFDKRRDQGRPIVEYGSNDVGPFVNRILPLDYSNKIERWNALAKFEYRPNDEFYGVLSASRFDYQYDEVRTRFDLFESGLVDQTATTGRLQEASGRARFDRFPLGQTIDTVQARAEFRPTELGRFEMGAYYSKGVQGHPYPNASFLLDSTSALGFTYDIAGDNGDDRVSAIAFNDPSVLSELSAFQFGNYLRGYFRNEEEVLEWKADYGWNDEGYDAGLGFKVGLKYRNLEKNRFDDSTNFTLADPNQTLTLEGLVDTSMSPYTADYLPGLNYPLIDADAFDAFFAANRQLFVAEDASCLTCFYDIQEDVTAAYGMLTFHAGPHTVLGGLRFERTEVDTVAALNGGPDQISRSIDYDDLLPSALYTYALSDTMKLRAGYAEALGRPNHPELAGAETFDEANLTIRRANPSLEPRRSRSIDVAFDWSIDVGQFFSAAAFYKVIDDQISAVTTQEVIDGQTFTVTQPVNLDEVSVKGIELSYTDDTLEFLPPPLDGLGILVNLTLMDGDDGPAPSGDLLAQPDYLFNLAGLYTYGPFSAKLTYNVVDDRPLSDSRAESKYEQLDLQLRYQLTDNVQLQLEGRNITDNPRSNFFYQTGLLREVNDFGNSWWLGLAYRY